MANAGSQKGVRESGKKAKARDLLEVADLQSLLADQARPGAFRRFMWRLMVKFNVFGSTYSLDPEARTYKSAIQDAGVYIKRELERVSDGAVLNMALEAQKDEEEFEASFGKAKIDQDEDQNEDKEGDRR